MSSLPDLEARVAALEADRADYRAVLTAVGALGQRVDGLTTQVSGLTTQVSGLSTRVDGIDGRLGNVEVKADANREAINALGDELAGHQRETRERFDLLQRGIDEHREETRANFRSVDEHLAEIRDLIVNGRGGTAQ